jgi:hypothetical protein
MNQLNAFYTGCSWRYYIRHPFKWVKHIWWGICSAYDRITKGYCDMDWMEFDLWFKRIASAMLRDMAMHGHGYHFETDEQWTSWLHRMADQLACCVDENCGNEYYRPYIDAIMKNPQKILTAKETEEEKELRKKYYERWIEVQEEQKELFKKTMDELVEHWDCLWD